MLPGGSNSCAVFAPLRICKSTGTVGGTNDAPLMVNLKAVVSRAMFKFKLTSAPPGIGFPGAPGFWSGDRLVSFNGLTLVLWLVGSAMGAPAYRRIAEFTPFANPVMPMLGFALIQ